jgi:hypothetical protein
MSAGANASPKGQQASTKTPPVDYNALVIDMNSKVDAARDRWAVVCETYTEAWDKAVKTQDDVFKKVNAMKAERERRARALLEGVISMAFVFLPMIGGPVAMGLAPILTARAQLFAKTMEKKMQSAWTEAAKSQPIVARAVQEIGAAGSNKAKEAMEAIGSEIIDALAPKYGKLEAPPRNRTPLEAFKDRNVITRGEINQWVNRWSTVNVQGPEWKRALIPVAHALLLNSPWVKSAPPEPQTIGRRESLRQFFELIFWVMWAQNLDGAYWSNVDEWYRTKYVGHSVDGKTNQAKFQRNWVYSAIDLAPIYLHFRWHMPREYQYFFGEMKIHDPSEGFGLAEIWTINPYEAFKLSRTEKVSDGLIRLLKDSRVERDFVKELRHLLVPAEPTLQELFDPQFQERLRKAGRS